MRVKSRWTKYLDLSSAVKRKRAIEWCMRFLRLNIEKMSESAFHEMVTEYECIVAYPENLGYYFFPMNLIVEGQTDEDLPDPVEEERAVREIFIDYQQKAGGIMADFKNMKDEPGSWVKLETTMEFTVRVGKQETFSVTGKKNHDFEYSYARQIATVLKGRKYDDVIKICPVCNNYFPILTGHEKKCCSHKCAVIHNFRNKSAENPTLARKKRNISVYYSGLLKREMTDRQRRSTLRLYIRNKQYEPMEIPRYIKQFIEQSLTPARYNTRARNKGT